MMSTRTSSSPTRPDSPSGLLGRGHTPRPLFSCHSRREERGKGDGSGGVLLPNFFRRIAMTLPLLRLAEIPDTAARENAERRSEESRVGKECVRTCRSRWSTYHYKKKNKKTKAIRNR